MFYDGFNDLAWQMNLELSPDPTNGYDRTTGDRKCRANGVDSNGTTSRRARIVAASGTSDVVHAYWDQSVSSDVYDALHD